MNDSEEEFERWMVDVCLCGHDSVFRNECIYNPLMFMGLQVRR